MRRAAVMRRVSGPLALVLVLMLLAAVPAAAATSCPALTDDAARLACFDRQALEPAPSVGSLPRHISEAAIREAGDGLRVDLNDGGMSGASIDIQNCYRTAFPGLEPLSVCMLIDYTCWKLDQAFNAEFVSRGMKPEDGTVFYFSRAEVTARIGLYQRLIFGNRDAAAYYGNAVDRVSVATLGPAK